MRRRFTAQGADDALNFIPLFDDQLSIYRLLEFNRYLFTENDLKLVIAKAKPLIAYPGTRVSSYGNSFKCCECGRNAIEDAKSLVSKTKRAEIVDGKLSLPGGVVHLVTPDSKTVVERRKKNKGPIYTQIDNTIFDKLSSTSESAADLITTIRRSIRRAPTDRYAKQGIDSLYVCPYIDCKNHINADANSAVNVARKFVEQLC